MCKHLRFVKVLGTFTLIFLLNTSCKKEVAADCETWSVMYWQGKKDRTTVTSNYSPHQENLKVCGNDKASAFNSNTIILKEINPDLFDYITYQGKR